eukprot:gene10355-11266_t
MLIMCKILLQCCRFAWIWMLLWIGILDRSVLSYKVAVIGASSGVGQLICSKLSQEGCSVLAIGRSIDKLNRFPFLDQSTKLESSTKNKGELREALNGLDSLVISVGTTAFPTKAWENGKNTPKIACYDTVLDLLEIVSSLKKRPEKIALLTSIGVDRRDKIPFSILNSFGVLTEKKRSEDLLIQECNRLNIIPIILPGRLVGEPFTNLDLAKLLKVQQKEEKLGILLEKSSKDYLVGDVRRKDVANSLYYYLRARAEDLRRVYGSTVVYSVVNDDGKEVIKKEDWNRLILSK